VFLIWWVWKIYFWDYFLMSDRYRPHSLEKTNINSPIPPVPRLNAKHKVLVLKARSKLERDAWCWALNAVIERLARKTRDRETRGRDGGLASIWMIKDNLLNYFCTIIIFPEALAKGAARNLGTVFLRLLWILTI
jgi:hypothetical protein